MSSDLSTTLLVDHGTEAQKQAWLPGVATGDVMLGMCLTEPDAGSDAAAIKAVAVRDGDDYVISGIKDPVMNGAKANLLFVVAKTDPTARARGMTMFLVSGDLPGITRRRIATMGYRAGDCAEMLFDGVRVPADAMLGRAGGALAMFQNVMKLDRMQIAARSLGSADAAFALTVAYCRERPMFGQRLVDLQNTQFELAEMEASLRVGRAFQNELVARYRSGELDADDAAIVKMWMPEMEGRVLDRCVQLWGSRGWVEDNPISRMYTAARSQRLQAGATELMKSLLGRRYAG